MLTISNISKSFGSVKALDNIDLKIDSGEFFALLGPSGCGKTTLLRIISGFEKPDNGDVLLNKENITHIKPYNRPTNLLFQSYALFPHLTVFKNIAYGLERENLSKEDTIKLIKMDPGTSVPLHSHNGKEYILVLEGSFNDEYGSYSKGDLQINDSNIKHTPIASKENCCISLSRHSTKILKSK